jgi:branched-chain amino acid transport system substrate-binding protein
MKKHFLLFTLALVAMLLVSCAPTEMTPVEEEEGPIKIGVLGPMTGDVANIGQNALRAAELAVEEVNEEGGINGRMLELIVEDGMCNPKDATNGANKLVNMDEVPFILGGFCSSETLAAAPIAEGKTVLISPGSSSPDITTAGDYIFRDYPSDSFAGKVAAEFAFEKFGARKAAVMYCLSDYCVGVGKTFTESFEALGGTVVAEEPFEQSSKDLRTELTKVKNAEPDMIYFVGYTDSSVTVLTQIKELGIEVPFLGGDAMDDPKIYQEVGEAAEGIIYMIPFAPLTEEFKASMLEKTGKPDITIGVPQAYDAIHIIADVMKEVGTDPEDIKNELYNVKDYEGVSGTITFDENGDLATANYAKKTVKDGVAVIYEE